MSTDEDMHEEIADVDPTPIHHPVDNEALETAVNETAEQEQVVADPNKEQQEQDYPFSTKEEDLAQTQPRKRIRRAGKVDVPRKLPKMDDDDDPHRQSHNPEIQAIAEDNSDPIRQEAAARVLAAEAAIPKVISKHEEKWNWMFDRLVEFQEKFKHTNVPQMYSDAPRLGRWVHYQRVEYWVFQDTGGGKISPDRIRRLESIGFEWNPQDAQWKTMFERLQAFQQEMGHCKVPKGFQKDVELANWVRNQRLEHANYLKGKKSRMTAERYHKLSDLGFKWSNLAANKVVNPLPFHEEETEAVPVKEGGEEDAPVEACIVDAHSKQGVRETSEV